MFGNIDLNMLLLAQKMSYHFTAMMLSFNEFHFSKFDVCHHMPSFIPSADAIEW
jgi:hypothetical protein